MTLQELQKQIYNGGISNNYIVFLCDRIKPTDKKSPLDTFLASQYINAIAQKKNLEIQYIESLDSLFEDVEDIFDDDTKDNYLKVYQANDIFDCDNVRLNELTNLIIIASKKDISDAAKDNCKSNIIEIPKLDNWQIKDYLYSKAKGVQTEKLDWLQSACGNNIYRIQQEIDKFKDFDETERDKLFDNFLEDGVYQDLSDVNTFSLSNALTRRDIHAIKTYYPEVMRSKDFSDMGFLIIVLNAFKNFLTIKLHPNPTEENTGLKKNQIYAISKTRTGFTSKQLINSYRFLSDIDRQIKTGDMWMDILVDYIIVKIMSLED